MSLSFADRENLWIQAGGNPAAAAIAAAVSMAENTEGDPNVISGTNDVGLWQINMDAHPQYGLTWLQNPLNNARAAVEISNNGSNWNPWTVYKSNAYAKYLGGSGAASLQSTSSSCSAVISLPSVGPLGGGSTLCMDGPIGLSALILGGLVVIVGFIILVAFTFEHTEVGKAAVQLAPMGRMIKAVR